jgi:dTDP-4-dehydrorhamnose reductase
MKILLTGPTGQVGSALLEVLPGLGEVMPVSRAQLDLARPQSIRDCVRAARPDVIVNTAAYTAVDRAETEEALATAVNAGGPGILAEEAAKAGALLIHFSTDYVFDGEKHSPYVEADATRPLNAYGRSKLAGELAVQASGCRYLIFRTSWVYAASGSNFLLTMLRLARSGRPLRVVDDQFGAPTSNLMIAAGVVKALSRIPADGSLDGTYHMSATGKTSWHGFARAIFAATGTSADLAAIPGSDYKAAARRPANSVLDNGKLAARLQIRLPAWDDGMRDVIRALR